MNGIFQDFRYALRQLSKNPGFTAVAVLTLGLGIGANTAIFSLVNGVLLEPLGFPQQDRLVQLTDLYPEGALVAMRTTLRTMEVSGYRDGDEMNLTGVGEPVRLHGATVSANFFSLLGVLPELGRGFLEGEDRPGSDRVVILSHALWRERFGSDPHSIGRSVMLGGVSREITGVMPAGFHLASSQPQFWVPLHLDPRDVGAYWGGGFMPVMGRLRPGVMLEQAYTELRAQIPQMRRMFPWKMPDSLWASVTVLPLQQSLVSDARMKLLVLLGAVSLVLLIACANVANLMIVRAAVRQRELAVRAAVGAGRWRVCRQLLIESVLLGAIGGTAGLILAVGGLRFLKVILPADTPQIGRVGLDWRVLAFTAAIAILTGLLFGIAPALHASRIDLAESVKAGWQRSTTTAGRKLRGALAIAEISLAVVLVISAGLTVRSLRELSRVHPGFLPDSILTARVTPNEKFCEDSARCRSFYSGLLEQIQALPGVRDAALVNVLPLSGRIDAFAAGLENHPQDPSQPAPVIFETVVSPDYFRVMGVPILRGRGFTTADMVPHSLPVGLITASTARKYWPNENPVGKHVKRVWDKGSVTIVGVVGDVNEFSLESRLPGFVEGAIYRPYGNGTGDAGGRGPTQPTEMTLVAWTSNDPASLSGELRRTATSINPEIPLSEIQTLKAVVSASLAAPRSMMTLFTVFAALALLLGAVGVYGVISYGATQRVQEIGIRMALGAQKRDVTWLVMEQGGRMALVGVSIGVLGALASTRLLASLLFAVSATDPFTYSVVSILLMSVALVACYIPARRAAKVNPIAALRSE